MCVCVQGCVCVCVIRSISDPLNYCLRLKHYQGNIRTSTANAGFCACTAFLMRPLWRLKQMNGNTYSKSAQSMESLMISSRKKEKKKKKPMVFVCKLMREKGNIVTRVCSFICLFWRRVTGQQRCTEKVLISTERFQNVSSYSCDFCLFLIWHLIRADQLIFSSGCPFQKQPGFKDRHTHKKCIFIEEKEM